MQSQERNKNVANAAKKKEVDRIRRKPKAQCSQEEKGKFEQHEAAKKRKRDYHKKRNAEKKSKQASSQQPKQQTLDSTRQAESEREIIGPALFLQGLDLRTQERLCQASHQFYLGQIYRENILQQLDFKAMCSMEDFPDRSTAKVDRLEEQ